MALELEEAPARQYDSGLSFADNFWCNHVDTFYDSHMAVLENTFGLVSEDGYVILTILGLI